ncbi:polysaccharide pyruvyl transferase family protein [Nocardioides campestrisoli]|uniref:polysaccharide pyruvyl transferase family protein n=1 Tax=Nocardioides campestrisoli TaxID=2736757 RepID=UPI002159F02A|nr:polysaccharide pyruvyl transferase family protein [Nocardioides campestrisoli]
MVGSANNSSNLGDECMWEAAAGIVRAQYPDLEIVTDGQHPSEWDVPVSNVTVHPFLYPALQRGERFFPGRGNQSIPHKLVSRPFRIRTAQKILEKELAGESTSSLAREWEELIAHSKGLVFTGAGAITDDYAIHGVYSWRLLTEYAVRHNVPIAFLGQGVGPLAHPLLRANASAMLNLAEVVRVRERPSLAVVQSLGVGHAQVEGDWALLLTPTDTDRQTAVKALRATGIDGRFLAISLHKRANFRSRQMEEYASLVSSLHARAETRGLKLLFVPNMTRGRYSDDRATARDILDRSGLGPSSMRILETPLSAASTKALLGLADSVITSRYHPLIFAMSEGVPTIGASLDEYYDQKLEGASSQFGVHGNVARVAELIDDLDSRVASLESIRPQPISVERTKSMLDGLLGFLDRALQL